MKNGLVIGGIAVLVVALIIYLVQSRKPKTTAETSKIDSILKDDMEKVINGTVRYTF
ncbi:MAG: hypothetical protein WC389_18280 [Lutibacter sp.]|jgi:uncharacterized membrane protein YukC